MSKSTKLKQQGQCFAAFFYLLLTTFSIDCYSTVLVSKLDTSTKISESWKSFGVEMDDSPQCWFMSGKESYVETIDPIDISLLESLQIDYTLSTYDSPSSLSVYLQISEDGINWKTLKKETFPEKITKGKKYTFSLYTSDYKYVHPKIRLKAISTSLYAGIRLFSINILAEQKPLLNPVIKNPTNITMSSFLVNWEKQLGVSNYEFALYKKQQGSQNKIILSENFDGINANNGSDIDAEIGGFLPNWKSQNAYSFFNSNQSGGYLKIAKGSVGGYVILPTLDLSSNNGEFTISFKLGSYSEQSQVCISANKENKTIVINESNYPNMYYSYKFNCGTENTVISFSVLAKTGDKFLLDDVVIEQVLPEKEALVDGYPKILGSVDEYAVEGADSNCDYYYSILPLSKYFKSTRASYGHVKTNECEKCIVESGDSKVISEKIVDGDLQINQNAIVRGNAKINGEISYSCNLKPNLWHSFSLPFIPVKVGGYINGKPYLLRVGYDYILQNYQNGRFRNADFGKGGFIIKVITRLDDDKLIFFSKKGTQLNEDLSINSLTNGYTHLYNPYTYPVLPSDLISADVYYIFHDRAFIPSENEVLPFQSFIAYSGPKELHARSIDVEYKQTAISKPPLLDVSIITQNGVLTIIALNKPVQVFSSDGKLVFSSEGKERYDLPLVPSLYLVRVNNKTYKVLINN